MKTWLLSSSVLALMIATLPAWGAFPTETGTTSVPITVTHAGPPPVPVITVTPAMPSIPDTTALGTLVATVSYAMSDGSTWTGTAVLSSNPSNIFALSGGSLIVNPNGPGVGPNPGTQVDNITILATSGPPVGAGAQTLLPTTQQSGGNVGITLQFLAGAGSNGNFVGNPPPAVIMPALPAFTGAYSLSGPDASKFTINPTTGVITVGSTALAAGTYNVTQCMTQSGVVGSPACSNWVLQGVDVNDTSTLFMQLDNYTPAPGGTVHVTVRNSPNASGGDYVFIQRNYNDLGYTNGAPGSPPYSVSVGAAGVHNAVLSIPVPNPPTDWYQFLTMKHVPNNGVGSQANLITSDLIVQPSIPFVMPTASNTLAPPFTPNTATMGTITVCPSGCMYSLPSQAIIGLSNYEAGLPGATTGYGPQDYELITVQAGAYEDCLEFGNLDPSIAPTNNRVWNLPHHLWIKGVGGGFAHISAMDNIAYVCHSKGIFVLWNKNGTPNDNLIVDNMEFSDWVDTAPSAAFYNGTGDLTLRNVYIHDGAMGVITANYGQFNFTIQNSRFARGGGPQGPTHNMYIGQEVSLEIDHTISQQALNGHEVKCRAYTCMVTCNEFSGSQDPYYVDSEETDFAIGVGPQNTNVGISLLAHLLNNTLVKGPYGAAQNNVGWAVDVESFYTGSPNAIDFENNLFIYDGAGQHWFTYIGPTTNSPPGPQLINPAPQTWSNNWFVGSSGSPDPYGVYPYYSYFDESPRGGAGYPSPGQITESGDVAYVTRAAAGLPAAQTTSPPWPSSWYTIPPPKSGCTGTIGNMAVP